MTENHYMVNLCCSKCEPLWTAPRRNIEGTVWQYLQFNTEEGKRCAKCGGPNPQMELLTTKGREMHSSNGGATLVELGEEITLREVVNDQRALTHAVRMMDYGTLTANETHRDTAMAMFDAAFDMIIKTALKNSSDEPVPVVAHNALDAVLFYMTNRIQHLGAYLWENPAVFDDCETPRESRPIYESEGFKRVSGHAHVVLEDGNTHLVFDGLRY